MTRYIREMRFGCYVEPFEETLPEGAEFLGVGRREAYVGRWPTICLKESTWA